MSGQSRTHRTALLAGAAGQSLHQDQRHAHSSEPSTKLVRGGGEHGNPR